MNRRQTHKYDYYRKEDFHSLKPVLIKTARLPPTRYMLAVILGRTNLRRSGTQLLGQWGHFPRFSPRFFQCFVGTLFNNTKLSDAIFSIALASATRVPCDRRQIKTNKKIDRQRQKNAKRPTYKLRASVKKNVKNTGKTQSSTFRNMPVTILTYYQFIRKYNMAFLLT